MRTEWWDRATPATIAITLLFVLAAGCQRAPESGSAGKTQLADGELPRGSLTVSIPPELDGKSWLYLNGEIWKAPPDKINNSEFELYPGTYRVEIAYSAASYGFPFGLSNEHTVNLEADRTTRVEAGGGNDWRLLPSAQAAQAAWDCELEPKVQDVDRLMKRFLNDPLVRALNALGVTTLPQSKDFRAHLDLPASQGGEREFDGAQIKVMANAVLQNYEDRPTHQDIDSCKQRHPELSRSYDAFDGLSGDFEEKLQMFHTMAGN